MMKRWLLAALLPGVVACADDAISVVDGAVDSTVDGAVEGGPAPDVANDVIVDAGLDVAPLDDGPFDAAIHPPPDDVVEVPCRQILVPNESPVSPSEVVCVPGRSERCTTGRGAAGSRACDGYGQWGVCLSTDMQVIRDNTTGMWRHGAPIALPPRLVAPLSAHRVTSRRPTLRWVLPDGMTRARVELCEDRACTRRVMQVEVTGSSWRPTVVLNPGVVFWRVSGLRDDGTVGWTSATWEFAVGYRDTPTDTIGRTLKDFNGDGFDDGVVSYGSGSSLGVLLGSREGGRAAPTFIAAPGSRYAIGDVNGDGYADLVTSTSQYDDVGWAIPVGYDGLVRIFFGGAGCPFQQTQRLLRPAQGTIFGFADAMAVADFNGDGYGDVVASFQQGLALYARGPDGLSRDAVEMVGVDGSPLFFFSPDNAAMRFVGDVDRDGYADLAVAGSLTPQRDSILQVYYGNPEGHLGARVQSFASTRPGEFYHVVGADFTGDGFSDVVVSGYNSFQLFVGSTDGLVRQDHQTLGANFGYVPAQPLYLSSPGDLNADGLEDLILDRRFVYRSVGAAGFSRGPTADLLGLYISSPGDLDSDGVDDVLATGGSGDGFLLFFRGGTFRMEVPDRAWGGVRLPVRLND